MELGLTPDTRWQTDAATLFADAAAAGFTTVGLSSLLLTADVPALLARLGLGCHELLGLVVTDEAATLGWATKLAEQAEYVGAPWVNTTFKVVDRDTPALARRCAAMFADVGARMAIEFSPLGPMATMQHAIAMATDVGLDRAQLVVDIWNLTYGCTTWADLEALPPERIAYVQFNDALPRLGELEDEALNRRTYPGEGVFEVERFADTLRTIGWDGVVSVQILSDELRVIPLAEFARRAYAASAPYWL